MAKITVEFDTVSKSLLASVDGKPVADVSDIMICQSYNKDDEFCCYLTSLSKDKENDTCTMTRLVASKEGEIKVESPTPYKGKAARDIAAYFGGK